jgi:hypothetical protein
MSTHLLASPFPELNGLEIARRHDIVRDGATPNFFEGTLLGNGDIGVCVTVRPDALGLHIGKSDSWDIRVSEDHSAHVLSFADLLKLWKSASDEAKRAGKPDMIYLEEEIPSFREYTKKVTSSYEKSWPRPWPCGTIWIHWDASRTHVVRQTLDISCGQFSVELQQDGKPVQVHALVNTASGHICIWSDSPGQFPSITYQPNLDDEAQLPAPQTGANSSDGAAEFFCFQVFPATAPTAAEPSPPPSPKDRNFALCGIVRGSWTAFRNAQNISLDGETPRRLRVDVALLTPRDHSDNAAQAASTARHYARTEPPDIRRESDSYWATYWSRSAVEMADKELERWWYHNQYWLGCCLREGKVAPGLFGNWSSGKIGTAWHGDYHMNYNTQQVFWGVFSSNHVEQHLPYIDVVESLMPMSRAYARDKFGLPGAYFPHSAYPVPSQVVPYPAPPWGYEICETPWVVQSLWWHYLYTLDENILKRVFPTLQAAAQFIAGYVKKGSDGRYHVTPTVSPENWGCTVDFRLNQDCIMDLALIDFLLEAAVEASKTLKADASERKNWAEIRSNLAPYPSAAASDGEVWLDVPNAPLRWIYNIPVTLAPVFPGERVGLHSTGEQLDVARRTARTIRLEGGNDIVYQPLIRARLGMLDLNWFKEEVRYCLMPNGIVQDRVRQVGGRYKDSTDFDFMMRMGVWTENLSLPAVVNECMLQSYSGTLHLFPNTQNLGPARFRNLRAAGAFLVSAEWDGKAVGNVDLLSERGAPARVVNPWGKRKVQVRTATSTHSIEATMPGTTIEFPTRAGERYRIEREPNQVPL